MACLTKGDTTTRHGSCLTNPCVDEQHQQCYGHLERCPQHKKKSKGLYCLIRGLVLAFGAPRTRSSQTLESVTGFLLSPPAETRQAPYGCRPTARGLCLGESPPCVPTPVTSKRSRFRGSPHLHGEI